MRHPDDVFEDLEGVVHLPSTKQGMSGLMACEARGRRRLVQFEAKCRRPPETPVTCVLCLGEATT